MVSRLLTREGHDVYEAVDGVAAVSMVSRTLLARDAAGVPCAAAAAAAVATGGAGVGPGVCSVVVEELETDADANDAGGGGGGKMAPYDVILMDGNMPRLNGADACRQIKQMGFLKVPQRKPCGVLVGESRRGAGHLVRRRSPLCPPRPVPSHAVLPRRALFPARHRLDGQRRRQGLRRGRRRRYAHQARQLEETRRRHGDCFGSVPPTGRGAHQIYPVVFDFFSSRRPGARMETRFTRRTQLDSRRRSLSPCPPRPCPRVTCIPKNRPSSEKPCPAKGPT